MIRAEVKIIDTDRPKQENKIYLIEPWKEEPHGDGSTDYIFQFRYATYDFNYMEGKKKMGMDELIRKLEDECISMKILPARGRNTMIELSRIYGDNEQYIYTKTYSWELIFYSGWSLVLDDFNASYEKYVETTTLKGGAE